MDEENTMTTPPDAEIRTGWFSTAAFGRCPICGGEHLLNDNGEMCGKG